MFLLITFITLPLLHLLLLPTANSSKIDEEEAASLLASAAAEEQQLKRAGGRAFNFAPDEKRGGARAFNFGGPEEAKRAGGRAFAPFAGSHRSAEKRGGARAFHGDIVDSMSELKRAGGRGFQLETASFVDSPDSQFNFAPDERKRGGARPFYGGGYMDGAWKRAGGRYFMRAFDDGPFSGWAVKRGGGHRFASLLKRGGGRSFFGGVDSLFDNTNYWAPQRYIAKYRRSPAETEQRAVSPAAPFFFANSQNWEKRGGGRSFGAK